MISRVLLLLCAICFLSAPCFPQEKVPNGLKKKLGVEKISVDESLSPLTLKQIYSKIKKQDYETIKDDMSSNNINVKKIIFSKDYSVSIRFNYSTFSAEFEADIYVPADKASGEIVKKNLQLFISYILDIKKVLAALDMDDMHAIFAPYGNGDEICVDIGKNEIKNDYRGSFLIKDIDITKLVAAQDWLAYRGVVYELKNYLMSKQLEKNKEVRESLRTVLFDDEISMDDERNIQNVKSVLKENNMYDGLLKKLVDDGTVDPEKQIARLKKILSKTTADYGNVVVPLDVEDVLGYYDLKAGISCIIESLRVHEVKTVTLSMSNSIESKFDKEEKALQLNIKDLFFVESIFGN